MRVGRGRLFAATVVCTMLCSLIPRPAYADPGPGIPDTGSRPIAAGSLIMPGTGTGTAPPASVSTSALRGPFAAKLAADEAVVTQLGQRKLQATLDVEAAQASVTDAEEKLRLASERVVELRSKADSAAADAYKHAAGLGPLDQYAHDLHQFGMLAPGLGAQPGGQEAAYDLLRAEQEESAARQEVMVARTALQTAQGIYAPIEAEFNLKNTAYLQLKQQNDAQVLLLEAAEDKREQDLYGNVPDTPVEGMVANPRALQALNYALGKIGSWYVWGDEGPNTFDCSGLAYWSYGQLGVRVPRVANDMYHGTPNIRPSKDRIGDQLLPGDLVFFASDPSDWRSIYHMGIYVGNGRMVHAPTTGEKVKIGPVKWSKLFGASRIFPAVPAPGQPPTTTQPPATTQPPRATTQPPPVTEPTTEPTKEPTKEPTTEPTTEPSTEPTTQPPPSTEPSKEPEPSKQPEPSSAAPSTATSKSASASPKPSVTTSSS
ncbi:NlpC/P60 family protein [Dactylosporangium sp. AC04546]|uniref:C40 family peptidase n=1 Tax=Dactylosporangium sp. AC04546 TaxID=2862460 RepID=UPI001EDD337C|nr:C40 family peptidase [Dactylosporangium sp. AC04546]WVK84021.1 NlpC/P60 family protein [Dactylosporangium sp. AC04546]